MKGRRDRFLSVFALVALLEAPAIIYCEDLDNVYVAFGFLSLLRLAYNKFFHCVIFIVLNHYTDLILKYALLHDFSIMLFMALRFRILRCIWKRNSCMNYN